MDPFVIPLKSGEKRPLETDWQLNTARLSEAAKRWPGVDRWGMPCGSINGVWCLDVDVKTHGPATLAALEQKHGPLPITRETRTQSGGRHLYFRINPDRPVNCWVGRLPGIDTRGNGGQAVIPPTPGYTYVHEVEPVDAPEWLYLELNVHPRPPTEESSGERPSGLVSDLSGALSDVRRAQPARSGERDGAVWHLALQLVRGRGLGADAAAELIEEHWNPRNDPPWEGEELVAIERACRRAETRATVPWGYTFYHGKLNDVLLRAIHRYGEEGKLGSGVPYRVYPDGRMLQLDLREGLNNAVLEISREAGYAEPPQERLLRWVTWWKNNQKAAAEFPKPLAINDEPGPAISRLVITPGPTDAWDEFLSRLDAPDTFLAWLWMLTLPVATRQVLWIQGDGADGKTVVTTVIKKALGKAATTLDDEYLDSASRWVGSQVYGKRLMVVDDTKMRNVLRRGIVHRITGRSPLKVEFKGVDGFDFEPNCAVLCTSNVEPHIGRGRADRTRLLPITVAGNGQNADSAWATRLLEQFPALMARAEMAYERLAVKLGEPQIRTDEVAAKLNKAAAVDDEVYQAELEKAGLKLAAGEIKGREFMDRIPYKVNSLEWHDFMRWLSEQGVTQRRDRDSRYWVGVTNV